MIFYFSSTGNCKYVAERIAAKTGDQLYSIADCLEKQLLSFSLSESENLGFVFPTYAWALPSIAEDFLKKARFSFSQKPYVFYMGTYGTIVGSPVHYVNKYLAPQGCKVDASFNVKMPDNWTVIFDLSDKEKVRAANDKAELRIAAAIDGISSRVTGNHMKDTAPYFAPALFHGIAYSNMRKTKHLNVDNSCIGCGLCAKKCPVQAIEMKDGKPVWVKAQCTMCLGCLHRCPKFAIQYDNVTRKHGQYKNPHTTI